MCLFKGWKEEFFIKIEVLVTWEASEYYFYYNFIIIEYISFFTIYHVKEHLASIWSKQFLCFLFLSLCLSFQPQPDPLSSKAYKYLETTYSNYCFYIL